MSPVQFCSVHKAMTLYRMTLLPSLGWYSVLQHMRLSYIRLVVIWLLTTTQSMFMRYSTAF